MMTRLINAHFDGKTIIPDEVVDLPVGQPLQVRIEFLEDPKPRFAGLLHFGVDAPGSPGDLGEQHDHYLYGHPKR
jgi:hypothetical protein